jgi:thymidylate synthase (FAD)
MRYSFKLITSIGVTREFNRHRVNSIAEQSTRYCNYSKDKFGGEVKFIIPEWWDIDEEDTNATLGLILAGTAPKEDSLPQINLVLALKNAEVSYMLLTDKYGWSPQQAREVLPLCTATEIVHTAFASDWRHFFDLRLFGKTGAPHPNMLQLATLMKEEAEKQGIWNDIMSKPSKF